MFAVCDNMQPLSEACFFAGSFVHSLFEFNKYFPDVKSINVYSDLRGKFRSSDFQYICTISQSRLKKILSSYSSSVS